MPPIMKRDTAKAVSDIMRIKKADENSGAEHASVDGSYEVSEKTLRIVIALSFCCTHFITSTTACQAYFKQLNQFSAI